MKKRLKTGEAWESGVVQLLTRVSFRRFGNRNGHLLYQWKVTHIAFAVQFVQKLYPMDPKEKQMWLVMQSPLCLPLQFVNSYFCLLIVSVEKPSFSISMSQFWRSPSHSFFCNVSLGCLSWGGSSDNMTRTPKGAMVHNLAIYIKEICMRKSS